MQIGSVGATLAVLPLAGLGVVVLAVSVPDFFDPCMEWGFRSGGNHTAALDDACPARSATSETRQERLVGLLLIPGGALLAAGLGWWGIARQRWLFTCAGALVLLFHAVPMFYSLVWVITFLSALLILLMHAYVDAKIRRSDAAATVRR